MWQPDCGAHSRSHDGTRSNPGQITGVRRCQGGQTRCQRANNRFARHLHRFGIEGELLTPEDCRRVWSHDGVDLLRTDDIEGGLWLPGIVQLLCRAAPG